MAILLACASMSLLAQSQEFDMAVPFHCDGCEQGQYVSMDWWHIYNGGLSHSVVQAGDNLMLNGDELIAYGKEVRVYDFKPYGFTFLVEVNEYGNHIPYIISPDGEMWNLGLMSSGEISLFKHGGAYFIWRQGAQYGNLFVIPIYEGFELIDDYMVDLKYQPEGSDFHIILDQVRYKDGIMFFDAHYQYPDGSEGPIIESVDLFHGEPRRYNPWLGYH